MIHKNRFHLFLILATTCTLLLLFASKMGVKAAACLDPTMTLCFLDPVKVTNFADPHGIDVGYINNISNVDAHVDFVASSPLFDRIRIRW